MKANSSANMASQITITLPDGKTIGFEATTTGYDIAKAIGEGFRITSYNVCYTKLLRSATKLV